MEKINRKILVVGVVIFLLLGASAMFGASASDTTTGPIKRTIPTLNNNIVTQTANLGNVKVSTSTGDDLNPRLTADSRGNIIIVYEEHEDIFTVNVPVCYTADEGDSWTEQIVINSVDFQGSGILGHPDIIYNAPLDLLYITAVDPQAEMYNNEMFFIAGDIAQATEVLGYAISGTSSSGYLYSACTCTPDYFLSLTSEDGAGLESIFGLGWFMYPDFAYPPGLGGFYYDGNSLFPCNPVANLEGDFNTNRIFFTFESGHDPAGTQVAIKSSTTDKTLINSGEQQNAMDKYGDVEQMPGEFLAFGTDPDVSGSGNNVAVAFSQGDTIKVMVSSCVSTYEPEFEWSTYTMDTGTAPSVFMQGNNIYCAYVKDGNLYYRYSEDLGKTWAAAEQKNDVPGTVDGSPGSVDVCKLGIAFVDTRDGDKNIYFQFAKGVPMPEIGIGAITGGIGVSAVITNTGDAAATNLAWSINTEGTVFIGKEKSGTIATLEPGASTTIKSGLMLGFGAITVKVSAGDATKSQDFKLMLIFVS